jgi:hypothetical protein
MILATVLGTLCGVLVGVPLAILVSHKLGLLDPLHDPDAGRPLMVFNDVTRLWDRARQQDLDVGTMPYDIPDVSSPLPEKQP